MASDEANIRDTVGQARARLDEAVRPATDPAQRDTLLAEALQLLAPLARPSQVEEPGTPRDLEELAGPLLHETSNFLNSVLLHLAVLAPDLPEQSRADLQEINRQGRHLAALLAEFRHLRPAQASAEVPVDLNSVVGAVVATLPAREVVQLVLTQERPRVLAVPADLQRLVVYLGKHAVAISTLESGSVTIRTEATKDRVSLQVEDNGPSPTEEGLAQLFDPSQAGREGTKRLELAAVKRIVQRQRGKVVARSRPKGGVSIRVDWPLPVG